MKLKSIRIKHFKNIVNEQGVEINLENGLTIVGPNNSGKTNIMEAIRMLFTGYDNDFGYRNSIHLPFENLRSRTSIMGTFLLEERDDDIFRLSSELNEMIGISNSSREIQLYLQFSPSEKPIYQIHTNTKRPTDNATSTSYSRKLKELTNLVLERFTVHYVPSHKSMVELYSELLNPFIKKTVSSVLVDHIESIKLSLTGTATTISEVLSECGLGDYRAGFSIPNNSIEELLYKFEFTLKDPNETSIFSKGMGIQAATFLASFVWITKQELLHNQNVIWLIEEPESYLHPNLCDSVLEILNKLSNLSNVIITTHSLAFVPQNPNLIIGTANSNGSTIFNKFTNYNEATNNIRESLGVRFSDFLNLAKFNIFVEGPSDKTYITSVMEKLSKYSISPAIDKLCSIRDQILIYELGGVSQLAGFLKANWEFIQKERNSIVVFDGDDAGDKARRELQGYFSNKSIPFTHNSDFLTIKNGFAIEYMFPDEWIKILYSEHNSWFVNYSLDFEGNLQPFKIKDEKKENYMNYMLEKANIQSDYNWANKWVLLLGIISKKFGFE